MFAHERTVCGHSFWIFNLIEPITTNNHIAHRWLFFFLWNILSWIFRVNILNISFVVCVHFFVALWKMTIVCLHYYASDQITHEFFIMKTWITSRLNGRARRHSEIIIKWMWHCNGFGIQNIMKNAYTIFWTHCS